MIYFTSIIATNGSTKFLPVLSRSICCPYKISIEGWKEANT